MTYTPRPGSNAHQLLAAIMKRHSIRTDELAQITNVPAVQISSVLTPAVSAGLLLSCKVDRPGQSAVNEYRMSEAGKALAFKELSGNAAARQGVATQRSSSVRRGPQPAVGQNTGSASPASLSEITSAGERAVASQAPAPTTKGRELGPAASSVPARNDMPITIDQDGAVSFTHADGPVTLTPAATLALGTFLVNTQSLWSRQ